MSDTTTTEVTSDIVDDLLRFSSGNDLAKRAADTIVKDRENIGKAMSVIVGYLGAGAVNATYSNTEIAAILEALVGDSEVVVEDNDFPIVDELASGSEGSSWAILICLIVLGFVGMAVAAHYYLNFF